MYMYISTQNSFYIKFAQGNDTSCRPNWDKGIHPEKLAILTGTNSVASSVAESSPLIIPGHFQHPRKNSGLQGVTSLPPLPMPTLQQQCVFLDLPMVGRSCEWNHESFCIRLSPEKSSKFIHHPPYSAKCSIVSVDHTHLTYNMATSLTHNRSV